MSAAPAKKRAPKRSTPHTGHPDARCWSVVGLARFLDCDRRKVIGMIRDGDLGAEKVRGQWRIAIAEVKRRFPRLF